MAHGVSAHGLGLDSQAPAMADKLRLLHGSRINDESFVGCISRLACMTHTRSVGEATLYRYMALVFWRCLRPCYGLGLDSQAPAMADKLLEACD